MTEMVEIRVNDRWPLLVPKHRAERPGWAWWERDALHALWLHIRRGDVVWDIGAEEGDLSALYASWGARVCLVEPSARSWPWIRETWFANRSTVHADKLGQPERMACCLVGNENVGDLSPEETLFWPDGTALLPYEPEAGFTHLNERGDTPVRTLDVLNDGMYWPTPDLIVMDTEGSELEILRGAENLLRNVRPTFAISVHPEMMRARYGDTPDDLLVLLEKADYECRYLGFTHEQHWFCRPQS